jgi:hypothetical protein
MGGLGNQLFQYARALEHVASGESLELQYPEKMPRVGKNGKIDLQDYKLCVPVARRQELNYFHTKAINLGLRTCNLRNNFSYLEFLLAPIAKAIEILTSVKFESKQILYGVLQHRTRKIFSKSGTRFIGYFQDSSLVRNHIHSLLALELRDESLLVNSYQELAKADRPLVVQIRKGDYLFNSKMGSLPDSYFREAVDKVWDDKKYGTLWFFSDSPELIPPLMDSLKEYPSRLIHPSSARPSEILEIMRLGLGYVISNSTFGWWAATLSKAKPFDVVVPDKWFKKMSEPPNLIPEFWKREAAWRIE